MKIKILLGLSVVLAGTFIAARPKRALDIPSDLRDAVRESASDQLRVSAPGHDFPVPAPAPAGQAAGQAAYAASRVAGPAVKEWTVMVFINGKNNLEMAGLYNVNKMEKVGSTSKLNIVAEIGRMKGQDGDTDLDGDWTGARRLFIQKDKDENKITSPVVQVSTAVDMGDYKRAVDFVKWSKAKYPAKHYMLILWDHGTGWMDPRMQQKGSEKGISFDDETGNYIRTKQIGDIVREAGGVDILAYDACLMQMAEVGFEVKDYTKVLVGSEEVVPGMGYPYDLFLGALAKKPEMNEEELGMVTAYAFGKFYEVNKKPTQLSAVRSSKLAALGAKAAEFAALAKEVNDADAMRAARSGVIRYDCIGEASDPKMTISFYGDLHQYAGLVASNLKAAGPKAAELKAMALDLQNFIDKELVIYNATTGKNRAGHEMSESRGISVYLPPAETRVAQVKLEGIFEGKYQDFAFSKAAGWHDFATYLYGILPPPPPAQPQAAGR